MFFFCCPEINRFVSNSFLDSLLELKKKKLLNDVDTIYSSVGAPVTDESTSQKDSKKPKKDSDLSDLIGT